MAMSRSLLQRSLTSSNEARFRKYQSNQRRAEAEQDGIIIPFSAETKQGRDEIWALIDGVGPDWQLLKKPEKINIRCLLTGFFSCENKAADRQNTRTKNIMGIIKAFKLGFDYLKYDEDGNVQDTQRAVNDVNLDIEAGQFVAVLGHNGSGKSTLAKHLNGAVASDGRNFVG